jgi:hypothetical protein
LFARVRAVAVANLRWPAYPSLQGRGSGERPEGVNPSARAPPEGGREGAEAARGSPDRDDRKRLRERSERIRGVVGGGGHER